jgi:iron(III) transport system ATP-binding protein
MIKVKNLRKHFLTRDKRQVAAVKGVSFELEPGEFYTLLGPSGCGKTTTLRCIAGFETPDEGEIWIGDQKVFSTSPYVNVPPHKRDFGIVFQSYAIWPHMSVFENVAFPLRHGRKRTHNKKELQKRVMEVLRLVQLDGLADRPVPFLSGGQQQRVALARGLVHEPGALLLDEPLSNLDAKLREEMRVEVRELLKRLHITTLYVTHDQLEALTMSDRVAVMNAGAVVQEGLPRSVYQVPANPFVAHFIGLANFLNGRLVQVKEDGWGTVELANGTVESMLSKSVRVGDNVLVMIRPEDVVLQQGQGTHEKNNFKGKIEVAAFMGDALDCWVTVEGQRIRMKAHPSNVLERGQCVLLYLPPARCRCVPVE